MPIYEYKCENCGHTFEVITSFSKNGTRKCERCGKSAHRLISPAGIIFRGSGFHVTDYGKSGGGSSARAGGSASEARKGKDITPKKEGEKKESVKRTEPSSEAC